MYNKKKNDLKKPKAAVKSEKVSMYFCGVTPDVAKFIDSETVRLGFSSKNKYFEALMRWVATLN